VREGREVSDKGEVGQVDRFAETHDTGRGGREGVKSKHRVRNRADSNKGSYKEKGERSEKGRKRVQKTYRSDHEKKRKKIQWKGAPKKGRLVQSKRKGQNYGWTKWACRD